MLAQFICYLVVAYSGCGGSDDAAADGGGGDSLPHTLFE